MTAALVRFVLDTDTVTHQQLGGPVVLRRLAQLDPHEVANTVVTMEEQLQGRLAAIHRQRSSSGLPQAYDLLRRTVAYFALVPVLPFDRAALAIYDDLVTRKVRIGTRDLRIAAITLAHRATLVTSNRRHFGQIAELTIEDWNAP